MPICRKCMGDFDADRFHNRSDNHSKVHSWCKVCERLWTKEHPDPQYNENRKDAIREWNLAHPDRVSSAKRKWISSNKTKHSIAVRSWQRRNPAAISRIQKNYRLRHPEKISHKNLLRVARKANAPGSFSREQFEDLKRKIGNVCLCCGFPGTQVKLITDHVVPLSRGGSNDISNIQPLCRSCNSRKGCGEIDYRENPCPFTNILAESA